MAAWIVAWFLPFSAPADIVLNWDVLTWTPGSLSQSYDIDPNNPGNDITITFSGNTSSLPNNSPAIDAATRGGQSPAQDSLGVHVDFANNSQKLTVTITFNYAYGVDAASFSLFDIDKKDNARIDVVSAVMASYTNGTPFGATITGSPANVVTGTGTNQTITGTSSAPDGSATGNASINFGSSPLDEVSFNFGTTSSGNPGDQKFWIPDLTFHPRVPEVGSAAGAVGLCGLAILFRTLRRRHFNS